MKSSKRRALVLIPGFGGGQFLFEDFVKNEKERGEFNKIFGCNIISPDVKNLPKEGALGRSERIIQSIKQLDENLTLSICTYSGGGFVVRCLMSILRANYPELYDRVELITIEDGAIRGAYVPPCYLIPQLMAEMGNMCKRNLPLPKLDTALASKLGREISQCWPIDIENHRQQDTWFGIAEIGNHIDRENLLDKLGELDHGRHWGEGVYTVGFSNGGIVPFNHELTNKDLVHYEGKICLDALSLRIVLNIEQLQFHTSQLACLEGTKIKKLDLKFTEKTGGWAQAPGCFQASKTGSGKAKKISEDIKTNAEDRHFKTKKCQYSKEEVAYIHTTSSLDIDGDPFCVMFGNLEEKSFFNEICYKKENQRHCEPWYRQINLERVKEGPPK